MLRQKFSGTLSNGFLMFLIEKQIDIGISGDENSMHHNSFGTDANRRNTDDSTRV